MDWPLQQGMDPSGYEAVLADPNSDLNHRLWAEDKLAWLKRGQPLPASVPITLHSITLGQGLRLVGLEGEPVAELGNLILRECGDGVTFPLGYTNGAQTVSADVGDDRRRRLRGGQLLRVSPAGAAGEGDGGHSYQGV